MLKSKNIAEFHLKIILQQFYLLQNLYHAPYSSNTFSRFLDHIKFSKLQFYFCKYMSQKNPQFGKNLQENPQAINRNQLNFSKAKMQYSFQQAQRFNTNSNLSFSPNKFYDLPNLWKPKGTSLGYGKKVDLTKTGTMTPAPGSYSLKSAFDKTEREGITMAPGREAVKNRDIFAASKMKSPTSTTYRPSVPTSTKAYSMGKKFEKNSNKWVESIPGPGNYSVLELTNERSKKMVSKYSTALGGKFSRQDRSGMYKDNHFPGPGTHDLISQNFGESLYEKAYSSKFGTGQRRGLSDKATVTPGPGTYQAFSEFLH